MKQGKETDERMYKCDSVICHRNTVQAKLTYHSHNHFKGFKSSRFQRGVFTFQGLQLLVPGLLHLVCDFGDDEVLGAHLPDGVGQGVQAPGVLGQDVQQHGRPLPLRGPTADLLGVVPGQDASGAQVVQVPLGPDLLTQVVPQSDQYLIKHERRTGGQRSREVMDLQFFNMPSPLILCDVWSRWRNHTVMVVFAGPDKQTHPVWTTKVKFSFVLGRVGGREKVFPPSTGLRARKNLYIKSVNSATNLYVLATEVSFK